MASKHHAVLLANHGPVVSGKSLKDAVYATEELRKLQNYFFSAGHKTKYLNPIEEEALKKEIIKSVNNRNLFNNFNHAT